MPFAEPKGYTYYGRAAITHTKGEVDKMRKKGIKVLSYYIGRGYSKDEFSRMYGKDAKTIKVTSLLPLAKTLNKMFLAK